MVSNIHYYFLWILDVFGTTFPSLDRLDHNINTNYCYKINLNNETISDTRFDCNYINQNFDLSPTSIILRTFNNEHINDEDKNLNADLPAEKNNMELNMIESLQPNIYNMNKNIINENQNDISDDFDFLDDINNPYISDINISDYIDANDKFDNNYFFSLENQRKIALDAKNPIKTNKNNIEKFKNNEFSYLSNCEISRLHKEKKTITSYIPKIKIQKKKIRILEKKISVENEKSIDNIQTEWQNKNIDNKKREIDGKNDFPIKFILLNEKNNHEEYLQLYCQNMKVLQDLLYIDTKMKKICENRITSYIEKSEIINYFIKNECMRKHKNIKYRANLGSNYINDQVCANLLSYKNFIDQFLNYVDKNEHTFKKAKQNAQIYIVKKIDVLIKQKNYKYTMESLLIEKMFSNHEKFYEIIHLKLLAYIFRFISNYFNAKNFLLVQNSDDEISRKCMGLIKIAKSYINFDCEKDDIYNDNK